MTTQSVAPHHSRRWVHVLTGGALAGALDITYAWVYWHLKAGTPPQRILQSVASGLLGRDSFAGGWSSATLGLGLHFFIALSMASAYYLVSRRWRALRERPVVWGAAYGLFLYFFMQLVVLPLSAVPGGGGLGKDRLWIGLSIAVHMFVIGVPIALFTRRAHRG